MNAGHKRPRRGLNACPRCGSCSGWKKGKVKQVWVEFTDEEWKRLKAGEEV